MAYSDNGAHERRNVLAESRHYAPIASGAKIWAGALLMRVAGKIMPAAAGSAGADYFGVALNEYPEGKADGSVIVEAYDDVEIRMRLAGTVSVAHLENAMYALDDETATEAATFGPEIGVLKEIVGPNDGWVRLRAKALDPAT